MLRYARSLCVLCLSVLIACLMLTPALAMTATVQGGYLRMRNAPSPDATVLERYVTGTVVSVLGESGDWTFVQADDGNKGYMLSMYLALGDSGSTLSASGLSSGTAYITSANGRSVNLRAGASKKSVSLARYPVGTKVTILGASGAWKKVRINGTTGYIMNEFLSTAKVSPPSSSTPSSASARVRSDNGKPVNMRTSPSRKAQVIGSYDVGTRVSLLRKGTVWSYISVGGQVGYMQTQYLR